MLVYCRKMLELEPVFLSFLFAADVMERAASNVAAANLNAQVKLCASQQQG